MGSQVLPQSPHRAEHCTTLVTPVVSPPCPGLGADVRVQRGETGEREAAVVAAQWELPHLPHRLHRHLRARLTGGDVVLVVIFQHRNTPLTLPLSLHLSSSSPRHLQLSLLGLQGLRLVTLLCEEGGLGGEVQSDPQHLHQAAHLLQALRAGDHREPVKELGEAGDDGATDPRYHHDVLQVGRESGGENLP